MKGELYRIARAESGVPDPAHATQHCDQGLPMPPNASCDTTDKEPVGRP